MEIERLSISARCPLFACRVCRTKTGWKHQRWCKLLYIIQPDCGDCGYWNAAKGVCQHPVKKKGGDAESKK